MKRRMLVAMILGASLISGGCESNVSQQYNQDKVEEEPSQEFRVDSPVLEIDCTITGVQPTFVPVNGASFPITYVIAEQGDNKYEFIYPYTIGVHVGKKAKISIRPVNGTISTQEFVREFTPMNNFDSLKRPLKTNGIITPNGIKYQD